MLAIAREMAIDVVLPMTEGVTHLLAPQGAALAPARVAGPDRVRFQALCDKEGLVATAARCGVRVPAGVVVREGGPEGPLPDPPCIVKPLASANVRGERIVYEPATMVRDAGEREREVARMVASSGGALVQEMLRGQRWRLHFARGRERLVSLAWRTERSYPPVSGMSSVSELAPLPPALGEAAGRLLAACDYRGVGSVQCFEDERGFVVHDVNLRNEFSVGASVRAGFDLPALAVRIALGGEPEPPRPPRGRHRYVWLTGELRRMGTAARRGRPRTAAASALAIAGAAVVPRWALDPGIVSDPVAFLDLGRAALSRRSPDQ